MNRRLEVLLHGEAIGTLVSTSEVSSEFRFLDTYRSRHRRPVLGQKFEDDLERTFRSRKGEGLPDFFANLVPEGRLRKVIEEVADLPGGDDLALLAFVGRDLPGAVEIRKGDQDLSSLGLAEPSRAESPPTTDETVDELRFSLAGVQLKFSMLLEDDKLTLPSSDRSGEWIAKFDSPVYRQLPENEFSMLEWARVAGFEVPECKLRSVDDVVGFPRRHALEGTRVLAIRRYDRTRDGGRIHQEDFAQVVGLPPGKKYDQLTHEALAKLSGVLIDDAAVDEYLRRLVLVIASGNNDAHLKNWSLVYPDTIQAAWSPLYDQVATVAWSGPDRKLSLKLAGVKDFGRLDRSTFERLSERTQLDARRVLEVVDETLEDLRQAWQRVGPLPLPSDHRAALDDHWRRVPLLAPLAG